MRAIVSARLSQFQKDGRPGIGLDTQDVYSTEYGVQLGYEIVAVVADTKSGTTAPWDRPNLKPWVTQPEKLVQYDAIIAYHNDRLSRGDWADEARIRLWAEENHKRLIIVNGPQWPPRHEGDKWQWEAMATQSRKEWEADRERSVRARGELRARGALVSRPPWGYTVEGEKYNRRMVPTDDGRKYIPQIYQRYVDGMSTREIAEWLTEAGAPSVSDAWWPRTVWSMIKNPSYIGQQQDKDGKTILRCEPLVDAALWNRAQEARHTSSTGRGPTKADRLALLIPLCPNCQWSETERRFTSPMYRITSHYAGKTYLYYRCRGIGPTRKTCGNMVNLEPVDRLVSEFLVQLDSPVYETKLVRGSNYESELAEIAFELKILPSQGLSEEKEDERRAALRAERNRLMALEPTADRVEMVDTGRTYGDEWRALDDQERRVWLLRRSVRTYAAKTATGVLQEAWPRLLREAMGAGVLLEDGKVSVALTWLGSGIYESDVA